MANDKQSGGNEDRSKQPGGSGNFANDSQRASEAGKKGGQLSHGGGSGQTDQSGSGSQQGAVQSDDDDDSRSFGKGSGSTRNRS
jgi:general stress protein YciG